MAPVLDIDGNIDAAEAITNAVNYINANYTTYDWSVFDNRINSIGYDFDNSLYSNIAGEPAGPDGKLYYVAFVIYKRYVEIFAVYTTKLQFDSNFHSP